MLRLVLCLAALVATTVAATTVAASTVMTTTSPQPGTTLGHQPGNVLYDFKHHNAFIVRADGCFEYHLNHQDTLDAQSDATRPALETRIMNELSQATDLHQMGSSHVDHSTAEIRAACTGMALYRWH